jgi:hypothetical protein
LYVSCRFPVLFPTGICAHRRPRRSALVAASPAVMSKLFFLRCSRSWLHSAVT